MSDDPCECVFNHEAMMRRLLNLLRDSQQDCTDSECSPDSVGPDGGSGNMLMIAMIWGMLAMLLFFMRPNSMRQNNDRSLEGKPRASETNNNGNEPPPPDVF
uniref:Small integral membrane protein 14 n=1 Tax=Acrobeloides nanus TaxID=290746 RepID=A0A914DNR4_9BILA